MDLDVLKDFSEIKTERLSLQLHTLEDVPSLFELRTDPAVMKYMDAPIPTNMTIVEHRVKEIIAEFEDCTSLNLTIKEKGKTEAIGYMSLWKFDTKNHRAEIGYALKRKYWKQGLSKEAAIGLINYGFNTIGVHSIIADINTENEASRALLLSLGFQKEAHFRENYFFNNEYLDSHIYGLIRSDYEKLHLIYQKP